MIRYSSGRSKAGVLVALSLLTACYEFPEQPPGSTVVAESANLDKIVSVGDMYIAGLMDGALYNDGQQHAFARIVARQVNGIELKQALIASERGYNEFINGPNLVGKFWLAYTSKLNDTPHQFTYDGDALTSFNEDKLSVKDMSVVGVRSSNLQSTTLSQSNPYFGRVQSVSGSTYLDEVISRNPTFLLIHIGSEDILRYILHGATGDFYATDPGSKDATSPTTFKTGIEEFVQKLVNEDRKGIILSIPNFLRTPLVTYTSPILDQTISLPQAAQTNVSYSDFNEMVRQWNFETPGVTEDEQRPYIEFAGDAPHRWGVVIEDETLSDAILLDGTVIPKWRQLTATEHILLPYREMLGQNSFGTTSVMPNSTVITNAQGDSIETRISDLNFVLKSIADSSPYLVFVDFDSFFEPFYSFEGVRYQGVPALPDFGQEGIFSADGAFLNPRGQAFLANEIIQAINDGFGANIPFVDPNLYRGNTIVNNF